MLGPESLQREHCQRTADTVNVGGFVFTFVLMRRAPDGIGGMHQTRLIGFRRGACFWRILADGDLQLLQRFPQQKIGG